MLLCNHAVSRLLLYLFLFGPVRAVGREADHADRPRRLQEEVIIPEWGTPSRYDNEEGGFAGIDFGYFSAQMDYGEDGLTGVSYYIRAFDLFPKHYTNQLGWGQWINPNVPQPAESSCPLNPHVIICYPEDGDAKELVSFFALQ